MLYSISECGSQCATSDLTSKMYLPSTLLAVWVLAALQLELGGTQEYRLPLAVRPRHYELALLYDLDPATNFSFFANVDILLTAEQSTTEIVLHAQDFKIAKDKVILMRDGTITNVQDVQLDDKLNFLTISLTEPLQEKLNYTLRIPFYGNLKKRLSGAYISSYINQKTQEEEYMVATQFEATWARQAFPCFDEPAFKATFQLRIGHHRDFWAITNTPLQSCSNENALESIWPWTTIAEKFRRYEQQFTWQHYSRSLPMSTYLVAWVVSKFESIESPPGLSIPKFRTWARSDALHQAEYVAAIGPKALSLYENWFGVAYPLSKMDLVAIPDFADVATENWGIIAFRENGLLYDKSQSSFLRKEQIAITVAHELAHQWFGNLVTMKWWSDIWLNEGFATFMSSLAVAAMEPDWKTEESLAVGNILAVLELDVLETSHPVSVPVEDPDGIRKIFDAISYKKGSSLIRMMTKFLGVDVFWQGINSYLLKYSYSNVEQDDLWNELTLAIQQHGGLTRDVTVKTVMDTWTKQTGYPVLNVTRDYSGKTAYITQKRYLNEGDIDTSTPSWWVPLNVLSQKESGEKPGPLQWLAANEGVATGHRYQHSSSPGEWVLFNADMIAPYRVNYDEQNWRLLAQTLQSSQYTSIPVLSRVQLLSDALALAWTNVLDYEIALNIVSYLSRETDYLPLSTALSGLSPIEGMLRRSADFGVYQLFVRGLIVDTYMRAGGLAQKEIIKEHDLISLKMQVMLSASACHVEVPGCQENSVHLFQQWMKTENPDENNPIPLDLRPTVYCVAMANGGAEHWNFLLSRKRHTNVAAALNIILNALACTREVWLLSQYLEMVVTEGSEMQRQDAGTVVMAVLTAEVGYYVAKEFFYSRIEDIHRACGGQLNTIVQMVNALTRQFTTKRELDEFKQWRERNLKYLVESEMNVNQAIEAAQVNVNWMEKNRRHVVELMKKSVQAKTLAS